MRPAVLIAVLLLSVGVAASAAAPRARTSVYDVHVSGTLVDDRTQGITTQYPGGGPGCTVVLTVHGHDTLTYSGGPLELTLSERGDSGRASMPFTFVLGGDASYGQPSGNSSTGGQCAPPGTPTNLGGCGPHTGSLTVQLDVKNGKVTISSLHEKFGSYCWVSPASIYLPTDTVSLPAHPGRSFTLRGSSAANGLGSTYELRFTRR